jgi:hypothetical protein
MAYASSIIEELKCHPEWVNKYVALQIQLTRDLDLVCESVCGHRDADVAIADADVAIADADVGPSLAWMINAIDCFTRSG